MYLGEVERRSFDVVTIVGHLHDVERQRQKLGGLAQCAGRAGLAAPQIGVSQRLFGMDCSGGRDPEARVALINPVVLSVEGEQTGDEGCLSFPGIFFPVRRSLRAVVRAQDLSGEEFEFDGLDLEARCMLHETDHCDGVVFIDRTTPLKRELVKRKIRRLEKQGRWI